MIHVFLDDQRACPPGFVLARNKDECLLLLEECEVGILSLDYELGWNQPNGKHVVSEIIRKQCYPKEIFLHTSDSIGRLTMYQMLYQNKPDHVILHNGPMTAARLQKLLES